MLRFLGAEMMFETISDDTNVDKLTLICNWKCLFLQMPICLTMNWSLLFVHFMETYDKLLGTYY